MELISVDQKLTCFHCGDECDSGSIKVDDKEFCCRGCVSVYEILTQGGLDTYYQLEKAPGFRQTGDSHKYSYLDHPEVQKKLLDFDSSQLQKIRLVIPGIHCSSCIWLLENLHRLHQGVLHSKASLSDRKLSVDFDPQQLSLRELVELLSSIGYQPSISMETRSDDQFKERNRRIILKIAVAGFCFGNIMLLSFPEYLGLDFGTEPQFRKWFTGLTMVLSLPVLFFCASDYFLSAFNGLRQRFLNIDVPITLGILALAGWSYYEIISGYGPGYLDSLAGLLFLLLVGKWFQNRTYSNLSFDRDFKAYFPLAVTKLHQQKESTVLVEELSTGEVIVLRNEELIPADSILLDERSYIDYSFVSGESQKIQKYQGDHIYAGGRHIGLKSRYQIVKPVSQSYLTQLWNHGTFSQEKQDPRDLLVNQISKYFTGVILVIAIMAGLFWLATDSSKAIFVITSVLIVACPCALSMATPFTLGNVMKVMGRHRLYIKNAQVIDRIAAIKTMVFDKTGTLTRSSERLDFSTELGKKQAELLYALTGQSNHPISREVNDYLKHRFQLNGESYAIVDFEETPGMGVSAKVNNHLVKFGSARFVTNPEIPSTSQGSYYSLDGELMGSFQRKPSFREGLRVLLQSLAKKFQLVLLSGDNQRDSNLIQSLFPGFQCLKFNQSPEDKLEYISDLEHQGEATMMLGDGLNDAGALRRSSVGLAVTEHPHHFTPASDGILHASSLSKLGSFVQLARWSRIIVMMGFALSFAYNLIGLSLAVTGFLTPLFAAILMPISSITVVLFSTLAVNLTAKKLKL